MPCNIIEHVQHPVGNFTTLQGWRDVGLDTKLTELEDNITNDPNSQLRCKHLTSDRLIHCHIPGSAHAVLSTHI